MNVNVNQYRKILYLIVIKDPIGWIEILALGLYTFFEKRLACDTVK